MRAPRTPFLATRPATPRDYFGAGAVLLLVLIIAGAVAPYAPFHAPDQESILSACQVAAVAFQLMTAMLLYGQWRAGRHASIGFLAVAFAFSALTTTIFLLEIPNAITQNGAIPLPRGYVGYYWFAWQLGTFVLIGLFIATARRLRPIDSGVWAAAAASFAFAVVLTACVTWGNQWLPQLTVNGQFDTLNERILHPVFLGLGTITLVALVAATRLQRAIDVYAALFLAGMIADAYLLLVASAPYSFGRVGGRIEVLLVSLTVGLVLIRRVNLMYRQLTTENRRLARAAMVDPLTGVANRRAFDFQIELIDHDVVLLIIDIDHFKEFNDLHGHRAGDDCIRRVARALAANVLRSDDVIARYGGDEFAAILHEIDLDDAIHVADRIRRAVADLGIPGREEGTTVTVSIGVAAYVRGEGTADMVRRADEALYRAKNGGRNRVAFDEETALTL